MNESASYQQKHRPTIREKMPSCHVRGEIKLLEDAYATIKYCEQIVIG